MCLMSVSVPTCVRSRVESVSYVVVSMYEPYMVYTIYDCLNVLIPRHVATISVMHMSICTTASTIGTRLLVGAAAAFVEGHNSLLFSSIARYRNSPEHIQNTAATMSRLFASSARAEPSATSERLVYIPTLRVVVWYIIVS